MNKDDGFDRLLRQASRARADRPLSGECLDAETLAAWTDGTLNAAMRSAAEAHAADCDRCLATLAAMAKTAPPPSVPQPASWFSLRWLAPLTAAVVAMTAWAVIQGPPASPVDPQPASTVSEAQKPAQPSRQAEADSNAHTLTDAVEKKDEAPQHSRRVLEKSSQAVDSRTAAKKTERPEAPVLAETRTAERQRAPVATSPPAAAPVAPPPGARADARDQPAAQRFAAGRPIVISSPDPAIRWRIANRRVERSTDAGRTWTAQRQEAEGELLAGTSPDPNVCWIVGTMGLVLLTTDGETWRRVDFQDPAATLVGVGAVSAVEATVTTSDGRTYRTTDGGRTWTLQENPGPAF